MGKLNQQENDRLVQINQAINQLDFVLDTAPLMPQQKSKSKTNLQTLIDAVSERNALKQKVEALEQELQNFKEQ